MKLGILSDLHLEFDKFYPSWDFVPEPDTLYLCAGDIDSNPINHLAFWARHKDHMLHVKGNHDYYGRSFIGADKDFWLEERNGIKIAGATLWTDLSSWFDWTLYKRHLIDARWIDNLTHDAYQNAYEIHKKFLLGSEADIIMSHHCPFQQSIHEKYRGDALNVCFANKLEEDLENMRKPPKLWVHGHTHEEFDYMIGSTRVICHPRGYPREQGYKDYKPKIIEMEF